MDNVKSATPLNGWIVVTRKTPGMIKGIHLPETSQGGRATWHYQQGGTLPLEPGDEIQIDPAIDYWIKLNQADDKCDLFMIKEETVAGILRR